MDFAETLIASMRFSNLIVAIHGVHLSIAVAHKK